jgi:uncharacterized protein YrrD
MRYADSTMVAAHDLYPGADVFSSDGKKLGTLHRVVLDRRSLRVTHIVVEVGFLRSGRHLWEGGVGLEYDRVVPIEAVSFAGERRVELSVSADAFKDEPPYTEEQFEPPQDLTPNKFDIFDVTQISQSISGSLNFAPHFWIAERLNKTQDESDIAEGTPVWRQHPHEKLGDVGHVLLDAESGRAQALIVRRGFLRKHDLILPVRYISELLDDIVRVEIDDAEISQLREYRPDEG